MRRGLNTDTTANNRIQGRQAGFTLIELMIAIAIIGILAAVAMPNYMKSRDQARYTACLDSLKSVAVAEEMYMVANHQYTDSSELLATYMSPSCDDPTGKDPKCRSKINGVDYDIVDARVRSNCRNAYWSLLKSSGGFLVAGTARDRNTCHICVGMSGYRPTSYKHCDYLQSGFSADCVDGL